MADIEHEHVYRMFRCLRCHRAGNSPSHIAGCDCASLRRCEEVFMVPAAQLEGAVRAFEILADSWERSGDDATRERGRDIRTVLRTHQLGGR